MTAKKEEMRACWRQRCNLQWNVHRSERTRDGPVSRYHWHRKPGRPRGRQATGTSQRNGAAASAGGSETMKTCIFSLIHAGGGGHEPRERPRGSELYRPDDHIRCRRAGSSHLPVPVFGMPNKSTPEVARAGRSSKKPRCACPMPRTELEAHSAPAADAPSPFVAVRTPRADRSRCSALPNKTIRKEMRAG